MAPVKLGRHLSDQGFNENIRGKMIKNYIAIIWMLADKALQMFISPNTGR